MKFTKRLVAVAVAIFIFVGSSFDAFAAGQPSSYSTSKNSGERDVVCTTLDGTRANAYYTGSYTYDNLSELSSSALLSSLRSLLTSTHTKNTSYNECRDYADETDCENGDGRIVTIYTSYSSSQSQYDSGNGWNREHVWPKSLGGYDTSGPGADLHHIRPSENKTNGLRGNLKYGKVTGGNTAIGNLSGESGGTYSGSYFEPLDNAKGDVARICLYMYVRYGGDSRYTCSSITTVFQSVEVLLEWCELDPVDTWEMGRNEVVASIQGNRNVFIDYPEYAWLLFGYEVPDDMVTPSGEAMRSSGSGDNTDVGDGNTNTGNGGNTNTGNGGNTNTGNGGSTDIGGGGTDTGNGGGTNTGDNGNTGTVKCTHTRTETVGALPGCVEQGYSGDTVCADCGKVLVYGTEFPPMGHSYGEDEVVIEPTETDKGIVRRVCSVCGNEELDILPRLAKTGLQVIDIVIIGCAAAVVVADIVAVVVWLFKRK